MTVCHWPDAVTLPPATFFLQPDICQGSTLEDAYMLGLRIGIGVKEGTGTCAQEQPSGMIPVQVFKELRCEVGRQGLPESHTGTEFRAVTESLWGSCTE